MPNWCNNGITIRHADPAMIDRVIKGKDGLLMEFLPTPQALLDTTAGSFGDNEKQRELEQLQEDNLRKYGFKDWYDWNCNNWGTKWDFNLENIDRPDANTVTAAFDTAWAPPIEAYNKLLEMGFEIEAMYYEPGMCFVGKYDNGFDDCIEYGEFNSQTVREAIGEELDDYFGISEEMAQYEEEDQE
jgi:hypothetical protein